MEYKLVQYTLNLKDLNLVKKEFHVIKETFAFPRDINNKYFVCFNPETNREFLIGDTSLFSIINKNNEVVVQYVDNGKNTKECEAKVKQMLTEYINNRQKENEKVYYQKTTENNNMLHSVKDMFSSSSLDFIENIKKQAIQCKELLTQCNDIYGLNRLVHNWGYNRNDIIVDIDNNGLISLRKALDNNIFVDNSKICCVQLEKFKDLGTVLYDFEEEKLYFSVFRGDEEYAIIEDTTLETLDEDYQAFLEKEEDKEIE